MRRAQGEDPGPDHGREQVHANRRGARVLLCLWLALGCGGTHPESFPELDVRAVYLYNFAAFVQWPESAFASSTSPVRYCVLANRSLQTSLRRVLAGETVGGRGLELVVAEDPEHWPRCHLLYIDHGFESLTGQILGATRGRPVLTVSDSEAFARQGGMIGLVRKGGRLKTFVNREALGAVGIRVSSKLLRISTFVSGSGANVSP